MKRLTHSNETERREVGKRAGFGAALAVAGLMGVAACATTGANHTSTPQTPQLSLPVGQSAVYTVRGENMMLYRLPQKISTLESEAARHWNEDRAGGYRSVYIVNMGNYLTTFGVNGNVEFIGAALIENGTWVLTGVVTSYAEILSRVPYASPTPNSTEPPALMPPQMMIESDTGGAGICRISIEPFRTLVRQITGREVNRLEPIFIYNEPSNYLIHFIPVDAGGNRFGEYQGGQLAVSTGFRAGRPQFGCVSGMMLLLEPGAPDPRNSQQ